MRSRLLLSATALFVLLVVPVALAGTGGGSDGPKATASASVKKKIKKLKKQNQLQDQQIAQLQQQLDDLARQPGPPGPPGEQGEQGEQGPPGPSTGPAGGDLTGNYPNPTIANGAVTEAKLGCQGNAPSDVMVKVGSVCMDRYENSIWDAPTGGNQITGAIPCDANGQDCTDIYARSVAGVTPRANVTWFQAQQALANSGKRLPTNAEWQMAVAGTPDSTDCNVSTAAVQNTGANAACISNHGANDMVGNLYEWVGDWDEQANDCDNWPAGFGSDLSCVGAAPGSASTTDNLPGALFRGGGFDIGGSNDGPFSVLATVQPSSLDNGIGFRGAR